MSAAEGSTRPPPASSGAPAAAPAGGPAGAPVRLDTLTGLRFAAAAVVVLHHAVRNDVGGSWLVDVPALAPLATLGYTGVGFFFLLSGFVLTWTWRPGRSTGDFLVRRLARIGPLHVVTWAAALALAGWLGRETSLGSSLATLLLVQAWSPSSAVAFAANAPSWSISDEAFFYALFPVLALLLVGRTRRALALVGAGCLVWLAAVPVVAQLVAGRDAVALFYYFPAYRVAEFVLGVCLALAVRGGWRPALPRWVGYAAVLLSLAVVAGLDHAAGALLPGSDALPRPVASLLVLPSFALLVLTAALGDLRGAPSAWAGRWAVRLGTWSFALYMTHLLVVRSLERVLGGPVLVGTGGSLAVGAAVLLGCVLVSGAVYELVERPAEPAVRALASRLRGTSTRWRTRTALSSEPAERA